MEGTEGSVARRDAGSRRRTGGRRRLLAPRTSLTASSGVLRPTEKCVTLNHPEKHGGKHCVVCIKKLGHDYTHRRTPLSGTVL